MIRHLCIGLLALTPSLLLGLTGYVVNNTGNTVSVFDTETKTVIGTIPVGSLPGAIAIGGGNLYVTNFQDSTVSVIDMTTNQPIHTIGVDIEPIGIAVGGNSVYVANLRGGAGTGSVSVIDMTTNSVITINDPSFNFPVGFAYNGRYLYVANEGLGPMGDGSISVIDTRINAVTSSFTLGPPGSSSPIAIAIRENYAYVTNLIPNQVVNVAVFDTRDNTLVTYITDPSFINSDAIVISGDEGYVANSASNSITVLDLKKNTVKGVFTADLSPNPNGPVGIAVARNHIYISDYTDDVVTVVNLKNGEISTISDPFSTFKDPTGIVLTTALYDINRLQPIYQIDYADAQNKLLDAGL